MIRKLEDWLPEYMVEGLFHSVGKTRHVEGEFYKNTMWIENNKGEGTEIPLMEFEAMLKQLFDKHF